MRKITLLVVDDDADAVDLYREFLEQRGHEVTTATSAEQARKAVREKFFDLLLLDERMPRMSGTEFLMECRKRYPGIGGIFITGYADVDSAVRALRAGAMDLLQKPVEKETLLAAVDRALAESQLLREQRYFRHDAHTRVGFEEIIGDSDALRRVLKLVRQVTPTILPVLLQGESGTGKDLLARAIHFQGPRKDKPFVAINTAAIPESLMESMLFGHKKGAFTGATQDRKGYFEAADSGTIFLDEIGEMTPEAQVRLLRVLQEKTIIRLGETRETRVNVRVIAATNKNLGADVKKGAFREDLFYRLNVVPITVPPLESRREDIPALAAYLVARHQLEIGKPISGIAPESLEKLSNYKWPGNVRELQNVIQRAIMLAESETIMPQDILLDNTDGGQSLLPLFQLPFRQAKKSFEQQYFDDLLARTKGNKTEAAKLAKLDRAGLHGHLRRLRKPGT
jgi:DNA-binding NtrC family response regulator